MDDIYDVVKAIRILTQRTDDLFKAAFKICSKFGPILSDCKYSIACHYMKYVIISDRKTISQRLFTFFIWFEVHIQPFFIPTNGLNI
jgi:hypothetical protein